MRRPCTPPRSSYTWSDSQLWPLKTLSRVAQLLSDVKARDKPSENVAHSLHAQATINAAALNQQHLAPSSDYLATLLRNVTRPYLADDEEYEAAFDDLEYLFGVVTYDANKHWGPIGRFRWRRTYQERGPRDGVLTKYGDQLAGTGLFGGSSQRMSEVHQQYEAFINAAGIR